MIIGKKNNRPLLDHNEIEALVPHSGTMCLIDTVEAWDEHTICCTSTQHHNPGNPLRCDGYLSAIHLIEFGAQSMAIHGSLLEGRTRSGMLAGLQATRLFIDSLDDVDGKLTIQSNVEIHAKTGAIYEIKIYDHAEQLLFSARATVINPLS